MDTTNQILSKEVEVIGHRGNVSSYPENTIEGFLSLLEIGADALELDLVISGDREVVVSHEPYMSASNMLTPDGSYIKKSEEKNYLLYKMSYDLIRKFDSGSRGNKKFPKQKSFPAYKPLLKEVFAKIEAETSTGKYSPLTYYLEIKSEPDGYGITQPFPEEYVDLVVAEVRKARLEERVVYKSFDAKLLNRLHLKFPESQISYLLYKTSIEEGLKLLDFKPEILSPYFKQLKNREKVMSLQQQGFKVIAWTVNRPQHIKEMLNFKVNGVISDDPEEVLKERKRRK